MQTLLLIAIALFAGLLMTRLFVKFHLPDVTAYLVAGVLIGPCVIGRLGIGFTSFDKVESLDVICDVALGFIAFAIGHEFRLSALKQTGKQATIIGILQAVMTTVLVDAVLIAGDVYDKAVPSEAATRMLDYFLSNLAKKNVYVYMVSGNHDSDERLNYGSNLMIGGEKCVCFGLYGDHVLFLCCHFLFESHG